MKLYHSVVVVLIASLSLAVGFEDSFSTVEEFLPQGFLDKQNSMGRIISGEDAVPGQFPYQAGLRMNKSTSGGWCGGALVSPSYVLTAAHCAINSDFIDVYLGAQNIRNLDEEGRRNIRVFADGITVHRAYNGNTISNDIAILRLPEPVEVTDQIKPINLPSYSDVSIDFAGSPVTISGWGRNANNAPTITDELQFTGVVVLAQSICRYYFGITRASNICTETIYGRGTCNGDSGGPMAIMRNNQPTLLGLTSFGSSSGCVNCFPSAFVRVTYYLDWIAANSDIKIQV